MDRHFMSMLESLIMFGGATAVFMIIGAVFLRITKDDNKSKTKSDQQDITEIKSVKDDFSAMPCPYCGAPLNGRVNFVVTCSSCGMKTKLK